jgi:hypothetical protein
MTRRQPGSDCGRERGAITVWTVVLVLPILAILAERRAANDLARTAALAGGSGIDQSALRQGEISLDPTLAVAAANGHLDRHGVAGTVDVGVDEITVTVTSTIDLQLLPLIGLPTATVTGTSTIRLTRGITEADQ